MPSRALLAISHGTASPAGQSAVSALVDAVAAAAPDVVVRLGHVDVQQPDVEASLAALDGPVTIVPLLLSAGYHVHVDLAESVAERADAVVGPALGPDPRLAEVLAARLDALVPGGLDADHAVVLAVAGSSDERANDDCRTVATLLAERIGRPVSVGFLAAAEPRLDAAVAAAAADGARPVVATYLMAPGYFHDLTVRLAGGAPVARPLLDDDAPADALVAIVLDRYRRGSGIEAVPSTA
ncbi:sirohydrochlorin chelatase [Microbacterium sp. No. 7]|uniref:sirohydrochlorin chelatase n=1 Tax=Microbacterium sp. No. 7 TaxID=1714373 RepID=UPI0006CFEC55|nr:CbiX/SirB N-terminal domain-containing protein [Microbacterium sp. No. 7]ALJ18781.1 cobalamin biosynthesis protein CbiX [Microbacterium sp. No. 7]